MIPPRLLWCGPRPIPRFNRQEPVTAIIRDPGFYEPTEDDDCRRFGSFCQAHDRPYWHEGCGEGRHLIALHCDEHGPEDMWPQPKMLLFPAGFDPPLSDVQLTWVQAQWDAVDQAGSARDGRPTRAPWNGSSHELPGHDRPRPVGATCRAGLTGNGTGRHGAGGRLLAAECRQPLQEEYRHDTRRSRSPRGQARAALPPRDDHRVDRRAVGGCDPSGVHRGRHEPARGGDGDGFFGHAGPGACANPAGEGGPVGFALLLT